MEFAAFKVNCFLRTVNSSTTTTAGITAAVEYLRERERRFARFLSKFCALPLVARDERTLHSYEIFTFLNMRTKGLRKPERVITVSWWEGATVGVEWKIIAKMIKPVIKIERKKKCDNRRSVNWYTVLIDFTTSGKYTCTNIQYIITSIHWNLLLWKYSCKLWPK